MSGISCFFSIRTTPMPSSSGICRSSSARSGRSRSIAASASLPDAASATIDHVIERSQQRREERSRRPLIVRDHDAEAGVHETCLVEASSGAARYSAGMPDLDGRAGAGRALDRQRRRGAVLAFEPPFDVAQADAARAPAIAAPPRRRRRRCRERRGRARAAWPADSRRAVTVTSPPRRSGAIPCLTAFSTSGCSTSGGTRRAAERGRHVDPHPQAIFEPGVLDIQVRLDQLQLAAERRELAFRSQHAAQERGQPHQRRERARRRGLDQVADGGERVEQEVRVDLGAQRPQLGLAGQLADFLLAQLARVALVRDSRIASMRRPTSDGDRVERGVIVRQQPASADQPAHLERVVRQLGDRHVDGRRSRCRAASASMLRGDRRRPFAPADRPRAQRRRQLRAHVVQHRGDVLVAQHPAADLGAQRRVVRAIEQDGVHEPVDDARGSSDRGARSRPTT